MVCTFAIGAAAAPGAPSGCVERLNLGSTGSRNVRSRRLAPGAQRSATARHDGRLQRRLLATGGARLWSAGGALVILVLSARALGPHGRGIYASAIAWATLASSLLYLSLGQVALHDVAGARPGRRWYGEALGTLLAIAVALSMVGSTISLAVFAISGGDAFKPVPLGVLALSLGLVPFLIWEQYGSALLAVAGRLQVYNRAQAVGRSLGVAAVAGLLWAGAGVYGVVLGMLLGQAIVAARGIGGLVALSDRVRPSRVLARRLLRGGVRLHLSAVGIVLITSADVLLVGHYRGATAVGNYQLATQALYALILLPQAATLVIYERMAEQGPQAVWEVQRGVVLIVLGAVSALAVLGAAAAPVLVHLVAGSGFDGAVGLLRIVLLAAPGFALSALMAPQWIGRGLFGVASAITVASGVVNIAANMILVPRFGADGAAATLVGTALVLLVPNVYLAVRCEQARSMPHEARDPDADSQPSGSPAG